MTEATGEQILDVPAITETQQIGQNILTESIATAQALSAHTPTRCEEIEIKKHPYIPGHALVGNGGHVGVIDIEGMGFPDEPWRVSVYEATGHLPLALKQSADSASMRVSMPLRVSTDTMLHPDAEGKHHPVRVVVTEDQNVCQRVRSVQQEQLDGPSRMHPAKPESTRQAYELVHKVLKLVQERPVKQN